MAAAACSTPSHISEPSLTAPVERQFRCSERRQDQFNEAAIIDNLNSNARRLGHYLFQCNITQHQTDSFLPVKKSAAIRVNLGSVSGRTAVLYHSTRGVSGLHYHQDQTRPDRPVV